jgi:hypothetical protein
MAKKVTIEEIAVMIQRGFKEGARQLDVDKRFDNVDARLERIERLILVDHKRRIERLEAEMKYLKDTFAIK